MTKIGAYDTLTVVKEVDFGVYLDGNELGEILLPKRYVPENYSPTEGIEVFIYLDSEARIIATTEKPFLEINKFANLEVASVSEVGAFLNWGLPKDLLLPFREQKKKVEQGEKVIVYLYLDDESQRLVASSRVDKFLDNLPVHYDPGQDVELLIHSETELGYKAIVDDLYWGMLYKNEIFQDIEIGQKIDGFIKKVRDDEKIDVSLQKAGFEQVDDTAKQILEHLKANNGAMAISDKSSPEEINKEFGISKKNFKKAVGNLYKRKLILIDDSGIRLK
jgi:predicted RNA-binding protein (virulence factor B family)